MDSDDKNRPTRLSTDDSVPDEEDAVYTVEEAITKIGCGYFQVLITLFYGCLLFADAVEFMLLAILSSIVKCQWNLSNSEEALVTSIVFIGYLVGSQFWGLLVHLLGRRTGLFLVNTVILTFGILSALKVSTDDGRLPGYPWLLICRFGVGFGIGGASQALTYFTEFLPPKGRGVILALIHLSWSLGSVFGALLALAILGESDLGWHWYLGLASTPLAPSLFFFLLMPESARFYLIRGKREKAQKVIAKVAWFNCKEVPKGRVVSHEEKMALARDAEADEQIESPKDHRSQSPAVYDNSITHETGDGMELSSKFDASREDEEKALLEKESASSNSSSTLKNVLKDIASLFTQGMWRTTCILVFVWFGAGWLHYGVILLTTTILRSDFHCGFNSNHSNVLFNDSLSACMEQYHLDTADYVKILWTDTAGVPGILLTVMLIEVIGRKITLMVELVACMISYFLLFVCASETIITLFLFLIHIFTSGILKTLYVYTVEVYPTTSRSIGLGLCIGSARIGAILTPYVAQVLLHVSDYATISLYGGSALVFAVLVFLLPIETKGRALHDKKLQ